MMQLGFVPVVADAGFVLRVVATGVFGRHQQSLAPGMGSTPLPAVAVLHIIDLSVILLTSISSLQVAFLVAWTWLPYFTKPSQTQGVG